MNNETEPKYDVDIVINVRQHQSWRDSVGDSTLSFDGFTESRAKILFANLYPDILIELLKEAFTDYVEVNKPKEEKAE